MKTMFGFEWGLINLGIEVDSPEGQVIYYGSVWRLESLTIQDEKNAAFKLALAWVGHLFVSCIINGSQSDVSISYRVSCNSSYNHINMSRKLWQLRLGRLEPASSWAKEILPTFSTSNSRAEQLVMWSSNGTFLRKRLEMEMVLDQFYSWKYSGLW